MRAHKTKVIRDPIHGNIPFDDLSISLVDTPYMQRLRGIKQNGLCYLVYPAMNSTRFEHSIGTMHVARQIAEHLELPPDEQKLVTAAALLHDVGHPPLSHTTDAVLAPLSYPHEKESARIIRKTEISDILLEHGLNPKKVAGLVLGEGSLSRIISSEIDADKMDYLVRDAYYAGVTYGVIDVERILLRLSWTGKELVVGEGGIEAAESLLIARSLMYQTVYRHHTKRIAEAMFSRALTKFLENQQPNEIQKMDDAELIHHMRQTPGYVSDMIKRLDQRRLFKIFHTEKYSTLPEKRRAKTIKNIAKTEKKAAKENQIPNGNLIIDIPEPKLSEYRVKVEYDQKLRRIDEVSGLARSLEQNEAERLQIYFIAPPEHRTIKGFQANKYLTA
ncbi:Deoxyguanosinetriphosphate triphosphohydrolase-like protein [uncultured archaeon]|nr:Deoxyguanosinetriphosphate triphosphohydrolase-like protein [uncultured archaeon]